MWVVPVSEMSVWSWVRSPGGMGGSEISWLGWGGFWGGLQFCKALREVRENFKLVLLLAVVILRCHPISHTLFITKPPMVFALVTARSWLSPKKKHVELE